MLVHISKLLGRMTGIQFLTGLDKTEHSPLIKPLCSDRMLISADDKEQRQLRFNFEFDKKGKSAL